jgi:hypothetical protein
MGFVTAHGRIKYEVRESFKPSKGKEVKQRTLLEMKWRGWLIVVV